MGIQYPYNNAVIPTSFATCSIGSYSHPALPENAGFNAVELAMPDLLAYGMFLNGEEPDASDYDTIVEVARAIKPLAEEVGVGILMLKPFVNFEGWKLGLQDSEREDAFARARGWLMVMEALGTDMLQKLASSDAEEISPSVDDLAADVAKLADMCAEEGFRVAYENRCWATRTRTWKAAWEIVKNADKPNLGLCLGTFQILGGEFGDPTTRTGLIEDICRAELESRWRASLRQLSATVPAEKIFLVQLSDAYRMDPPIKESRDSQGSLSRFRWSQDHRPLPR
ncbi:xylose isomerase-like protein [Microdochium trichocladiopsis]|uniref:Xylose isomerase-like protein n=1 Tax=Microdochium trichocladiopsis TaxID=1682393 RepID=A0A9P8Y1R5_9PEZI|nr:xylose isomerase-like protein [Microdochium trichocladiopsis]KAH7025251.1 xylose isomerase-like protein [Microdochium trichocladiopsis]